MGSSNSNFLVKTGVKFLCSQKDQISLRQISIKDKERYLLQLIQSQLLAKFDKIILIGSIEDGFVQYQSSILTYLPNMNSL